MRTPIYLAEKKNSKYAYQALLNLEKAIMMSNAFTERKYGPLKEEDEKTPKLKSSLKPVEKQRSLKKLAKLPEQMVNTSDEEVVGVDQLIKQSEDIESRLQRISHIEHLKSVRDSIKSSRSSLGGFTKAAKKAKAVSKDQDKLLAKILKREKEELNILEK